MTPGQVASFKAACTEYSPTGTYVSTAEMPYSCETGDYTVDQIEGDACAWCGKTFRIGEASRPVAKVAEFQLFAHIGCPKAGASR